MSRIVYTMGLGTLFTNPGSVVESEQIRDRVTALLVLDQKGGAAQTAVRQYVDELATLLSITE